MTKVEFLTEPKKVIEVKGNRPAIEILRELNITIDSVVLLVKNKPFLETNIVGEDETLQIISVFSGG